jgi:transposase, IS30 family
MSEHQCLTELTGVLVFFTDPQSPWQRGSNENANGLLRQYLLKGTDLAGHSQAELDAIAGKLNNRPGKIHGLRTPVKGYHERRKPKGRQPTPIEPLLHLVLETALP